MQVVFVLWAIFVAPCVNHFFLALKPLSFGNIFQLQKQPPECSVKIDVLKNFAIFTGKHLCWDISMMKLQIKLIKCFLLNIAKFL